MCYTWGMKFLRKILDIFFPPSETEKELIARCASGDLPHAPLLPHKNIYAVTNYREPIIRKSIRILKTKHNVPIARCFATLLHEHIESLIHEQGPFTTTTRIVIIPIPITTSRLRERGFNQAELIADSLALCNPVTYVVKNLLHKVTETQKQAMRMSKTQRKENIKGCFMCSDANTRKESGVLYVVLDDVITTGATMHEAMKTLRKSGYGNVIGFGIAH